MKKLCLSITIAVSALVWQNTITVRGVLKDEPAGVDKAAFASGPSRIIIKPKRNVRNAQLVEFQTKRGINIKKRYPALGGLQVIEVPEKTDIKRLVAEFKKSELVDYAEVDQKAYSLVVPNDSDFSDQWGLHNTGQSGGTADADIDAPEAWDIRTSASSVIVAVVDSGAVLGHEDLSANLWVNPGEIAGNSVDDDANGFVDDVHGINAILGTGDPSDDNGHGTHVSGIIGANGNNTKGITGVAWQVKLMSLKGMGNDGSGNLSDLIECLDYARENGAHIVNASWGTLYYSQSLYDAISALKANGIILVAAAGNDGNNTDQAFLFPASYRLDNIVSVAASTRTNSLAYFSSYGYLGTDIAAPGAEIYSTYGPDVDGYTTLSGTSMAAPHVSGALAIMKAQAGSESYLGLIYRMLGAVDTGTAYRERVRSGGMLNLKQALDDITSSAPSNDSFANRISLAGRYATSYGRNSGASKEVGEPWHAGNSGGKSVWWTWTAPSSGAFEFTTAASFTTPGTQLNTLLGVYTGTAVSSLATVGSNNDSNIAGDGTATSRLILNVIGGTTYQIAVDGSGGAAGHIRLSIAPAPVNDNLASAHKLNGSYVGLRASNIGAGKQANENSHGGNAGGRSVWWSWSAPLTGTFILTTIGSDFDTIVAVYTGSSFPLTSIASNNNDADTKWNDQYGGKTSAVTFNATAGQTYRFAVDGYQGAAGNIVLAGAYRHSLTLPTLYHGEMPRSINNLNHVLANDGNQTRRYELDSSTVSVGPNDSFGYGLSALGKVAGRSSSHAMLWTPPGTVWSDTSYTGIATDVNDNDIGVGYVWSGSCSFGSYPAACYWDNGVRAFLPNIGTDSPESIARSINHLNEIVGSGYLERDDCWSINVRGVLWELENGWIDTRILPPLGAGRDSECLEINARGEVLGGSQLTGRTPHPTLWVDTQPRDLIGMGNGLVFLSDINNRAQGGGYYQGSRVLTPDDTGRRACLWQNNVFIDLNKLVTFTSSGSYYWANLSAITSINDFGTIVGHGEVRESGWFIPSESMFVATPPTMITIFDPTLLVDDQFQMTIRGPSGITCTVQACTDLVTGNWSNIDSVLLSGGVASFTDPQAVNYNTRFYRVFSGSKHSENVVGYHIRTIPSGFSMIANPFIAKDNRLPASMPNAPSNTMLYQFDSKEQKWLTFHNNAVLGGWSDQQATLEPGESALINSPSSFVWKCVGDVRQNVFVHDTVTGLSLQSSSAPLAGNVTTVLGFVPSEGDKVHKNINPAGTAYTVYSYSNGSWSPSVPSASVGEGFWIEKAFGEPWVQNYSAW